MNGTSSEQPTKSQELWRIWPAETGFLDCGGTAQSGGRRKKPRAGRGSMRLPSAERLLEIRMLAEREGFEPSMQV
jgi:hypothetical protein